MFKFHHRARWKTGSLLLRSAKLHLLSPNSQNSYIVGGVGVVMVQELFGFTKSVFACKKTFLPVLAESESKSCPVVVKCGCERNTCQLFYTCCRLRLTRRNLSVRVMGRGRSYELKDSRCLKIPTV